MERARSPKDVEALILAHSAEIAALRTENDKLVQRIGELEEQLRLERAHRYAPRSEKVRDRIFNEAEQAAAEERAEADDTAVPDTGLPQGDKPEPGKRMIMNAILFMLTTGCQWRQIPREFAPFTTIQSYFYRFSRDGTLERINHALVMMAREQAGREPTPTAGVIDSQSVKTTEAGGPRGFDAGKKINGRKRHIITDTLGHLVGLDIHAADIQDRDGAVRVIKTIRSLYPWLRHLFADGGYAGPKLKEHLETIGTWTLQIVKRSDATKGFVLLPRRWVVERTLAWLGRCRRLAKDFEATIQSAAAWVFLAHIRRLTRKIARR